MKNEGNMDLAYGSSTSTQTFGMESAESRTINFSKEKQRRFRLGLLTIICAVLLLACLALATYAILLSFRKEKDATKDEVKYCTSSTCLEVAAAVKKSLNESVDPCEDFYQYSCGSWIENNPIPPSETTTATFITAAKKNDERLLLLLLEDDELPREHAVKKAKNYFKSCMTEDDDNNTATVVELKSLIRRFGSWPLDVATWNVSTWSLNHALLEIHRDYSATTPLFAMTVDVNPFDSSRYILKINPPSLSLIREQYLTEDNKTRVAYVNYMTKIGKLLGSPDSNQTKEQMEKVLELEGKLAQIIPPASELGKNFLQNMNMTELERLAPGFEFTWLEFINELLKPFNVSLNASDIVMVPSPEYLRNLSYIVNNTSKETMASYVIWNFVQSVVPYMSHVFRSALLEYQKETIGTKSAPPRWYSCIEDENGYYHGLTFALGYIWISKVFDVEIIPFIQDMSKRIRSVFRNETSQLDWIDDETRRKIDEKEDAMKFHIGFPKLCANETLLNEFYKDLNISENDYLKNVLSVMIWKRRLAFSKLKTAVDKDQWFTGPQKVNAFYLRSRNEISILAGILQPPFYYGRKAPRSINLGGIGVILAHELSHGFDAAGRKFNENGEVVEDWWSSSSSQGFKERSKCIVDQYSKFSVDVGGGKRENLNGELTLSENIADNGGIRMAYLGYKDWLKNNAPEPQLPGLQMTHEQLLFVSFSQAFCAAMTPSAAFRFTKASVHSIPRYRIIGSLSNMEEFSEAFKCSAGRRMNPKKKCKLW